MVVYRDCQHLFCLILTDYIFIQNLFHLHRCHQIDITSGHPISGNFFFNDL